MTRQPHLCRKLQLQEAVRVSDNAGGYSESWVTRGTVWADLWPGAGRAREGAAATLASVPYRVFVRAAPAGSPSRPVAGQRFVEGARVFAIQAVSEWDREGRFLECFTREEVSA